MKALCTKKTIFFIITLIMLLLLYNGTRTVTSSDRITSDSDKLIGDQTFLKSVVIKNVSEKKLELKYILQWTSPFSFVYLHMGKGRDVFIKRKCPYTNCIVTANRSYLDGDYSKFDVIVFAGPEMVTYATAKFKLKLPEKRSPHQKYVFATMESGDNYPVCSDRFNRYFNWTWTFKLDSEVRWSYLTIRDKDNAIVGPNKEMHWMKLEDMDPVSDDFKQQLKTKTKAAAWFVTHCYTICNRELIASQLKDELQKYGMILDIFGACGNLRCSPDKEENCDKLVKRNYYFYLSFENSFSEDYVTEKLLRALNNDAVPIVYGGANYTRFMPDGIYLDAGIQSTKDIAAKMYELINDPEKYAEYFKWKNHYSYHTNDENVETDPYCLFCTTLNNEEMVKRTTIYDDFRKWWMSPPGQC